MAMQLIMGHTNNTNNAAHNGVNISSDISKETTVSQQQQLQEKRAMFHDFFGVKPSSEYPAVSASKHVDASATASISVDASSGGGRGPPSAVSDLASERQVGNHLEGIPFYGPRSEISGPEISNRLVGGKRSNSDSAFIGPIRDGILQMTHGSVENLHMMKIPPQIQMLKNGGSGERQRRFIDEESLHGLLATTRPASASLIPHSSGGSRPDGNLSKWERSIPMGTALQYPTSAAQFVPSSHQNLAKRFRDTNAGPSIISQSAADEGSRTGIKGSGVLSSVNAGNGNPEKNLSGTLAIGTRPRPGIQIPEPESSTPSSRHGLTSPSRQMTIFYGGQAYVFDEVHPNKADVIMALAGSNGGSWSTTYSPKPTTGRPGNESYMTSGEGEAGMASNAAFQREFRGRPSAIGNPTPGVGFGDRISVPTGHHGSNTEARNPMQGGEPSNEEKREA